MQLFNAYGTLVSSEFPLEAFPWGEGSPEFKLISSLRPSPEIPWHFFHNWPAGDSHPWLSYGRYRFDFLFRFHELADFHWHAGNGTISLIPGENLSNETLNHLFLDIVLPLALSRQGKTFLHAGAVAGPSGALAFLGASGIGKSTLVASLRQERGFPLLTDDGLRLEEQGGQFLACPGCPSIRLWPDSICSLFPQEQSFPSMAQYSLKQRIPVSIEGSPGGMGPSPVPLKSVYLLAEGEGGPLISPLAPASALIELVKHSFRLEFSDPLSLEVEFRRLTRLSERHRFFSLSFRRDLSLLPMVLEAILKHQAIS